MKPEFLPQGPAFVVEEDDIRILVVADTHFGVESDLERKGVHIMSNTPERLRRLLDCIDISGAGVHVQTK